MSITLSQLVIYPVKSCGGISLSSAEVVPGGLRGDRRYMLVDGEGQFLTQRTEPKLKLVHARFSQASAEPSSPENQRASDCFDDKLATFELAAPNVALSPLLLSEEPTASELAAPLAATVWRDTVTAIEHRAGSAWFSQFLQRDVRLIYLPEEHLRQVNLARSLPGDRVSFADGYPLLLTSESSLDDLNARLSAPIPMTRFRPNVVIRGALAYAEDTFESISFGSIPFACPKLCDRCVVTTVDEEGHKGKEPLKTLASYRRWDGAVWFGANVIPRALGRLHVGQEITIESLRAHPREASPLFDV